MSLIDRIRAAGVELKADGDKLLVRGAMTAAQRDWLTNHKTDVLKELRTERRPIVEYRYADDDIWHVMLGRPGESFEEAAAAAHRQFGAVLTREREALPAGFPFKRHGDEGEWKDEHGNDLDGPEAA
jgi:hypothetical protein